MLVVKELKARYRGTFLGFFWSFFNPLLAMLTYILVFSVYMRVQIENYSIFLLSGLLPWFWFSSSINEASNSILTNGSLIKKIAMPIEIFPFVYVASNLMNFLLSIPILIFFLIFFKIKVGLALLFFPIIVLIQFVFIFGAALFVSSITVKFRDFIYLIPNIISIWYFLTPILYPASIIPEKYSIILRLNPFAYFAIIYQDMFLNNKFPSSSAIFIVAMISMAALIFGGFIFKRLKYSIPEEV